MSSEVPLLTFSELDEIARNIQIDYCLGKVMSFDSAFARAVEQAVRAQWAAEVEPWKAMVWALARELNCLPSTFSDGNAHVLKAAIKLRAERDSAQAEAKAAKAALKKALDVLEDVPTGVMSPKFAEEIEACVQSTIAALQPGEQA